jgi:hypothetical protein
MQILSNDPDEPVSTIALLGEAIIAPVIEATPDSLGQAVLTDQIATKNAQYSQYIGRQRTNMGHPIVNQEGACFDGINDTKNEGA